MDERLNHLPERWLNEPEPLVVALKLDMTHYWQPTAGGYFGRVSKGLILESRARRHRPRRSGQDRRPQEDAMAKRAEILLARESLLATLHR